MNVYLMGVHIMGICLNGRVPLRRAFHWACTSLDVYLGVS
jgi:hypothetical protein